MHLTHTAQFDLFDPHWKWRSMYVPCKDPGQIQDCWVGRRASLQPGDSGQRGVKIGDKSTCYCTSADASDQSDRSPESP